MALSWLFLKSLTSFLVKHAAQPVIDRSLELIDEELHKLHEPTAPASWDGGRLTSEQREFVRTLPHQASSGSLVEHLRSLLANPSKRGIVLLGPSGAGKSQIYERLRGRTPGEDVAHTNELESTRLTIEGRRVPMIDGPGELTHAPKGYAELVELLLGRNPPEVAILVVAGGYLASSMPALQGTLIRPHSRGIPVAETTEEFVAKCREEETNYIFDLLYQCKIQANGKPWPRARLRSVITLVNKSDLWGTTPQKVDEVIRSYSDPETPYGQAVAQWIRAMGADGQCSHDVFPMFTHAGGFHPDPWVPARALPPFQASIDTLMLRTLVSHRYTGGAPKDDVSQPANPPPS